MRFSSSILLSYLVLCLACGDDDTAEAPDAGMADAGLADAGLADAGMADAVLADGGTSDSGDDAAADDAGSADGGSDAGSADAGPEVPVCGEGVEGPCCFDVSETIGDLPFVIPDTFDETTPTWNRPTGDCPSEALSEDAVPFVAYSYCNKSDSAADFQFEVAGVEDEDDEESMPIASPVIVAYSGTEINADPAMCGALNEPIFGLAELVLTLEPGQVVTIVSTTGDAEDYGDIQSIAGEPTE